jgi:hypothetical protein
VGLDGACRFVHLLSPSLSFLLNSPSFRCTTPRSRLPLMLHHPAGNPTAPPVAPRTPGAASSPTASALAVSPRQIPRPHACRTAPTKTTPCPVWRTDPNATAAALGRTIRLRRTFPRRRVARRARVHRGRRAAGLGRYRSTSQRPANSGLKVMGRSSFGYNDTYNLPYSIFNCIIDK